MLGFYILKNIKTFCWHYPRWRACGSGVVFAKPGWSLWRMTSPPTSSLPTRSTWTPTSAATWRQGYKVKVSYGNILYYSFLRIFWANVLHLVLHFVQCTYLHSLQSIVSVWNFRWYSELSLPVLRIQSILPRIRILNIKKLK